ncbi:MAG TPA: cell surface protein SprA, partial [Chitinispirillaceae bacterium]|nr:cell surface protein SprA [Chitinispirillaceae bacterium]
MPGTELSGYSESNQGLFGIKVRSQLGPLSLTSVISHERGEAVKSTFSPDQGGEERVITEEDYVVNRFFFLDNRYRRHYNRKYGKNAPANPSAPPRVDTLIVWRSVKSGDLLLDTVTLENDAQPQVFVRLYRDRHYFLNETEGWIRFADTPDISNSFIAIYMRTSDTKYNKGTITKRTADDTTWNLWVLKPKDPIDSASANQDTSRFHLMWRNVYDLDASDWANFKFRIVQKTNDDENEREENENSQKFSDILGISSNGTMSLDKPYIFDRNNGYLVIPPWDTSFFGNEPFRNPALGKYQDSAIYKSSKEVLHRSNYSPFYKVYTVSAAKQTTFNLGWDVMEGEIVKADGNALQRNIDYIIDYSSGEMELVSPAAKNANKITVEYQRSAMFVPEKKVFFGTRGELKLPFISDGSFAGLSFLYQNVKVNEEIPQLEQEPYNKGLLDFNIRIDLAPEWMTNLINKIPLINTNAESKMVFDVEYARSFVNPNPEGKAYVDDFEDSKKNTSLPITANGWYQASPPFFDSLTPDSLHRYPPAWDFYWFTPRDDDNDYRVGILNIKDINQNTATTNANDYETVLRLHCTPSPGNAYNLRYYNTWAGIMTPVYIKDKTEDQYFEFIVKAVDGFKGQGKLLIQMGTVREDLSINGGPPNKAEDAEDPAIITNPGTFDSEKDNGLDTIKADSLEYYLIPGEGRLWDTLRYHNPVLGPDSLDPGRDRFKKYEGRTDGDIKNRRYANRRQGDDENSSEDINSDYMVYTHKTESYFQYTIDLENDTSPFIDKNANVKYGNGWRKYRIPLKEVVKNFDIRDSVGNPSWKNIEFIRLIWNGFDSSSLNQEHQLIFNEMQFAGSQWLPLYDSLGTKIEASAITNKEDNFYRSQVTNEPLVLVERDENDDEEQESSLRLNFKNIEAGDTALVTKSYNYHQLDLSSYRYLSLALYGRNPDGSTAKGIPLFDNKVHFVFRFGSDDSTYYEYRSDIYSGWQQVKIDLRRIAEIKDSFMINHSDTVPIETSSQYGRALLRVVSKASGRQPNFSRIQWVGIGVIRDKNDINPNNSVGEIWVDEMKVSGIDKLSGRAIRANISTQWADFINLSGNLVFTDGDFR